MLLPILLNPPHTSSTWTRVVYLDPTYCVSFTPLSHAYDLRTTPLTCVPTSSSSPIRADLSSSLIVEYLDRTRHVSHYRHTTSIDTRANPSTASSIVTTLKADKESIDHFSLDLFDDHLSLTYHRRQSIRLRSSFSAPTELDRISGDVSSFSTFI